MCKPLIINLKKTPESSRKIISKDVRISGLFWPAMAARFIAGLGSGSQNVNQTDELNWPLVGVFRFVYWSGVLMPLEAAKIRGWCFHQ
jgi:hypothetical protein